MNRNSKFNALRKVFVTCENVDFLNRFTLDKIFMYACGGGIGKYVYDIVTDERETYVSKTFRSTADSNM